jgi:hypothetical protein
LPYQNRPMNCAVIALRASSGLSRRP